MVPFAIWISHKEYVYTITNPRKLSQVARDIDEPSSASSLLCLSLLERHMLNILLLVVDNFKDCCTSEEKKKDHLKITPLDTNDNSAGIKITPLESKHGDKCNSKETTTASSSSDDNSYFMRKTVVCLEIGSDLVPHRDPDVDVYNVPIGINNAFYMSNNTLFASRLMANSYWLFSPSHNVLYDNSNFTEFTKVAQMISIWMQKSFLDWARAGVKVTADSVGLELGSRGSNNSTGRSSRSLTSTGRSSRSLNSTGRSSRSRGVEKQKQQQQQQQQRHHHKHHHANLRTESYILLNKLGSRCTSTYISISLNIFHLLS